MGVARARHQGDESPGLHNARRLAQTVGNTTGTANIFPDLFDLPVLFAALTYHLLFDGLGLNQIQFGRPAGNWRWLETLKPLLLIAIPPVFDGNITGSAMLS